MLLANGAAAESLLDASNDAWLANAPVALLRFARLPNAHADHTVTPCAEVVQGGPRLAAIRDGIALRAAATNDLAAAAARAAEPTHDARQASFFGAMTRRDVLPNA